MGSNFIASGLLIMRGIPAARLVSVQGYRQAVRHSTLTAAVAGSNPASPAYSSGCNIFGTLAQAVEHLTFNQVVWGSNPQCLMRLKHPESQILCGFPGVLFMVLKERNMPGLL